MSRTVARRLSALDVHYPPPGPNADPLTGARVAGLGDHLADGRPVSVTDEPGRARFPGSIGGTRESLIRPDGYIGWASAF